MDVLDRFRKFVPKSSSTYSKISKKVNLDHGSILLCKERMYMSRRNHIPPYIYIYNTKYFVFNNGIISYIKSCSYRFYIYTSKPYLATLSPRKNLAMSWSDDCQGRPLARTIQFPSISSSFELQQRNNNFKHLFLLWCDLYPKEKNDFYSFLCLILFFVL